MAKIAILVGIISMIMMQSVRGVSKINNQDDVENAAEQCVKATKLKVKGYGRDLDDLDGWTAGQSDPYMEVVATDESGGTQTLQTPHKGGTNQPTWSDYLIFNEKKWKKITVKVMDYDGSGRDPDPLCPTKEITLKSGSNSVTYDCNPGKATVEYVY